KRQAGAGESRTAGDVGGKKGQEGRRDHARDSRDSRGSAGSSSPKAGRGATGQDSGGRYGRQEAGGGPHLQHRTCPAPACTSLLALTHCRSAGRCLALLPLLPRSFLLLGWLAPGLLLLWLVAGWLAAALLRT
ncbi:hypothetical protein CPAR01_09419, partial [Colletotrichum paranaense]